MLDKFFAKIFHVKKWKLAIWAGVIAFVLYYFGYVAIQMINPMRLLEPETVQVKVWPWEVIASIFTQPYALIFMVLFVFLVGWRIFSYSIYRSKLVRGNTDDDRFVTADNPTHGSAKFMSDTELSEDTDLFWGSWDDSKKVDGVLLGTKDNMPVIRRKEKLDENYNMTVFGAAGAGKSSSMVIPFIWKTINGQHPESIICVDTKGTIYSAVAMQAHEAGYDVKVFNLKNPEASQGVDILTNVGIDQNAADSLAEIIFSAGNSKKDNSFWNTSAQNLVKALILAIGEEKLVVERAEHPVEGEPIVSYPYDSALIGDPVRGYGTIGRMFEWISVYEDNAFNSLCARFSTLYEVESIPHPSKLAWNTFKASAGNENVGTSIILNSAVALKLFSTDTICALCGADDIDLEAPAMRKCLYFVNVDDQDTSKKMISTMFFSLLTQKLVAHADNRKGPKICEVPVNLLIDEFGAVGTIPNFNNTLAGARSRGIRTIMAMQNIEQVRTNYPDAAETIISNTDIWVSFKCNDPSTAKWFSDTIGHTTIINESTRTDRKTMAITNYVDSYSDTSSNQARLLLLPEEVMSLGKYECLVYFGGSRKPIILTKAWYGNNPLFKEYEEKGWKEEEWDINSHKEYEKIWAAEQAELEEAQVVEEEPEEEEIDPEVLRYQMFNRMCEERKKELEQQMLEDQERFKKELEEEEKKKEESQNPMVPKKRRVVF